MNQTKNASTDASRIVINAGMLNFTSGQQARLRAAINPRNETMELFTAERLIENSRKEIGLVRNWLDSIERDVNNSDACVNAAVLLYLSESCAKLSYGIGMLNKARLDARREIRKAS